MNRRSLLRASGVATIGSLSGCLARVRGWSSLRAALRNDREQAVTLGFRVDVKGFEQVDREYVLDPGQRRTLELAVDVPYGATVRYHATDRTTGEAPDRSFQATTPPWSSNPCSFEALVTVGDGVSIEPYCDN